jgi:hypothetical protein
VDNAIRDDFYLIARYGAYGCVFIFIGVSCNNIPQFLESEGIRLLSYIMANIVCFLMFKMKADVDHQRVVRASRKGVERNVVLKQSTKGMPSPLPPTPAVSIVKVAIEQNELNAHSVIELNAHSQNVRNQIHGIRESVRQSIDSSVRHSVGDTSTMRKSTTSNPLTDSPTTSPIIKVLLIDEEEK